MGSIKPVWYFFFLASVFFCDVKHRVGKVDQYCFLVSVVDSELASAAALT